MRDGGVSRPFIWLWCKCEPLCVLVVNWHPGISLVGASIALMPHVNTIPSVFPASPENPLSAANLLNPGAKVLLIEQLSPLGALRKMSTCVWTTYSGCQEAGRSVRAHWQYLALLSLLLLLLLLLLLMVTDYFEDSIEAKTLWGWLFDTAKIPEQNTWM